MSHAAVGFTWSVAGLEDRRGARCVEQMRKKRGRDKVGGASRVGHAWAVRDERAGGDRPRLRLVSRLGLF